MAIVVLILNSFNHNLHNRTCKEHSYSILEGKRKVLVGNVIMSFELSKIL